MSSTSSKGGTTRTDCTRPLITSLLQTTKRSTSENNRFLRSVHPCRGMKACDCPLYRANSNLIAWMGVIR